MTKEEFIRNLVNRLNNYAVYNNSSDYFLPLETKYYCSKVFKVGDSKKLIIPYFADINKERVFNNNCSLILKINIHEYRFSTTSSTYATIVKKLLSCCSFKNGEKFKYTKSNETFVVIKNGIYYREADGKFKLLLMLCKCINNITSEKDNYLVINRDIYRTDNKLNKEIRSYIPYFIKYGFQLMVLTSNHDSLIQELIIKEPLATDTLKNTQVEFILKDSTNKVIL